HLPTDVPVAHPRADDEVVLGSLGLPWRRESVLGFLHRLLQKSSPPPARCADGGDPRAESTPSQVEPVRLPSPTARPIRPPGRSRRSVQRQAGRPTSSAVVFVWSNELDMRPKTSVVRSFRGRWEE